jgi:hypothetical protein
LITLIDIDVFFFKKSKQVFSHRAQVDANRYRLVVYLFHTLHNSHIFNHLFFFTHFLFSGEILIATPRRELAPPLEEDEEMDSETHRAAPLREIENNISALLRGDIAVARIGETAPLRRPVGFRPGVHKSESAKEMLLSQLPFGPLPATPPASSPEIVSTLHDY